MAELNIPLWKVYELAANYAVKEWSESRILAGLDCYTDAQITAYLNRPKSEIEKYRKEVKYWRELETELRTKSHELQRRNNHKT